MDNLIEDHPFGRMKTVMEAEKIPNCAHVMALSLIPEDASGNRKAVVRMVTERDGTVDKPGFFDSSELGVSTMNRDGTFTHSKMLNMRQSKERIDALLETGEELLGLEDPDCWVDPDTGLLHLYFTIALVHKESGHIRVYLGHAEGSDIDHLTMTEPVLSPGSGSGLVVGKKEVCIPPKSSDDITRFLVEASNEREGVSYSAIQRAESKNPGTPWTEGPIVKHPLDDGTPYWCSGHISPGPLLPQEFIDVGDDNRVGFLNGRDRNIVEGEQIRFRDFVVGLFVYDFEKGEIVWVSEEPVLKDSTARKGVTFASCVDVQESEALLYAHIDDSRIRTYEIVRGKLEEYLSKYYLKYAKI